MEKQQQFGHQHIKHIYVDNCCNIRAFLTKKIPDLSIGISGLETYMIDDCDFVFVKDYLSMVIQAAYLDELIENDLKSTERVDLGLDVEWDTDFDRKTSFISVIQIAHKKKTFVFQVAKLAKISEEGSWILPIEILSILERESLNFVGACVSGDMKRLKNDFGIRFRSGYVNLQYENVRSLSKLSELFLCKRINKNMALRCGDWSGILSREMIEYAAIDAKASLEIYRKIMSGYVPQEVQSASSTRCGLDAFHALQRINISKKHVLYARCLKDLRDSIFLMNSTDLENFKEYLNSVGISL